MKILASFCNQPATQNHNLVVLDTLDKNEEPLINAPVSFTGLAQDQDFFYALAQDKNYGLYIFDKNSQKIVFNQTLPHLAEAHSLLVRDEDIFIVSTGTDQVLHYTFDRQQRTVNFQKVLWQPAGSQGTADTHHLNSIALVDGQIIVTGFGLKANEKWSSAKQGYAYNITTSDVTIPSIYHPHSLVVDNHRLFYCESSSRSVYQHLRRIIRLESGYTRGLAVKDDWLILGTSSGRKHSKSTGLVNNPADPGALEENCRILLFKKNFWGNYKLTQEIDLFPAHTEIYDLLIIS